MTTTTTKRTFSGKGAGWVVSENKRERTIQIDTADGRGTVVQPRAISWLPDAHLIAAAPEMLEALRNLVAIVGNLPHTDVNFGDVAPYRDARALLARIEG